MLEVGLAVEFVVVNATMRADGKVYNISTEGSGLDDSLAAGRLNERLTGVGGMEDAIDSFVPVIE